MTMYTTPVEQILDGNGDPIVGAKKFLLRVGTTTKKTIYSDAALTVSRANPVLSDADGRFPQFFLNGLYDEEQQDDSGTATGYDGATLWGPLPVGEVDEGALTLWATDNTYDIPEIVLGSDDEYYRSLTDSNTGNDPVSSPGSWEQLQFGRVWNTNVTYAKGETVYGDDGFLYISTQGTNLAKSPPLNSDWWRPATNQNQSAIAAGTVDAITAVMPIPLQSLNDETMVTIRASGANTVTNPTFAPDGLTAKTIVKNGNQALIIGDIFGAGHELQLKYNSSNDVWELINPYNPNITATSGNSGSADITTAPVTLVTLGSINVKENDIVLIQGYSSGTKGGAGGNVAIECSKSSGTATIEFYGPTVSGSSLLGDDVPVLSSAAYSGRINGSIKALTAGTLVLKMTGTSSGSNVTSAGHVLHAMVLRG